jgi:hypothetical protein
MASKGKWSWILWWQVDAAELEKQVREHDTLKLWQSARGISVCCILLSIALTALFVALGVFDAYAAVDVVIMAVLAVFIYRGHRWAMFVAMVLWTLEKALSAWVVIESGRGGNVLLQVLWWCIYMHAFYLALRVEQQRRKPVPASSAPAQ